MSEKQEEENTVEQVDISQEMKDSYAEYASSVILDRAIPDARDGLKPVQRRILYSMFEKNIKNSKSHRKSSNIVGKTMGDYHPHGDKAIYDALVRMAQEFSLLHPLVDGQGNFGSTDDDPPASARYTEARLSKEGEEMLEGLKEHSVEWVGSYDDRGKEPSVLPSKLPNLLVNGSQGIAVGLSCKLPSHNLNEVCDAIIHFINSESISTEEILDHIKGPDFPTGGKIISGDLETIYSTGSGTLKIQSTYDLEEDKIVITSIPYQTSKSKIKSSIMKTVEKNDLPVKGIRDESSKGDVRIVIEANPESMDIVKNHLLKNALRKSYGVRMVAIADGEPEVLSLKDLISEYVNHRRQVIRSNMEHKLQEHKKDKELAEGKIKAIENSEEIVEIVKNSEDSEEAVENITSSFDFTQRQAEHIIRIRISSLTNKETASIKEKVDNLENKIKNKTEILEEETGIDKVIKEELEELKEKYGKERQTQIDIKEKDLTLSRADLTTEKEIINITTEKRKVKAIRMEDVSSQSRGGKGLICSKLKQDDIIKSIEPGTNHDEYLVFSSKGKYRIIRGYEIPIKGRNTQPEYLKYDIGDSSFVGLKNINPEEDDYVVTLTKNGYVKKSNIERYTEGTSGVATGAKTKKGDRIVAVETIQEGDDIAILSKNGRTIRFNEKQVSETARRTTGVKGIQPKEQAVSMTPVKENHSYIMITTSKGYSKRTEKEQYKSQNRNGKGLIGVKTGDKNGHATSINAVTDSEQALITTKQGKIIKFPVEDINPTSRNTYGVRSIKTDKEDEVTDTDIVSR